jgi:mannitol 2-dehydrogenase
MSALWSSAVNTTRKLLPVNSDSLSEIALRGVSIPTYDRTRLLPRIVHIGVGGFHRAHMALYTHELAESGSDWAIVGLGLMPADTAMADALGRQDYLYTLTERMTGSATTGVIGSLIDMRIASADHNIAEATITDPMVAIVSLTITEAGYREPATGQTSTCDVLAQCLDARRTANGAPLTILSCDNLPGNGDVTKRALLAAARRRSVELATWVESTCTFPNSMVDRITPAATTADRQWLHSELDIDDQRPVVAEQFRQWVIEDNFAAGRPNWESVGVLFTDNVHQWELYKLRMLNAGHSCLAYLSALAGVTYVDEAMAHSVIRPYVEQLLSDEAVPTLSEIAGHRREDYVASVLERFSNIAVRDQIARLCIDGTAKFPTFLIPTIERQLDLGGPICCATLALAGWHRYLATVPVEQQSFDASGPQARQHAHDSIDDPAMFLNFGEVFPSSLRDNDRFRTQFVEAAGQLRDYGPVDAMMKLV